LVDRKLSNSPLLIGGCPRSGTTALVQLLNSNSSVFISSEENLLNASKVLGKLLQTRERRTETYKKGLRAVSEREKITLDNILTSNYTSKAVWPTIQYLCKWHHKRLHKEDELLLWGDKFPNYYKELDTVLKTPRVRYLHITRNPVDVVNSMLRRTEMAKQGRDWWKTITNFDNMIETWASAYSIIRKYEYRPDVLHIHYEELVFCYEITIKKINKFLDIDLRYKNILVSDPDKHYGREYITLDMISKILENPAVAVYVKETFKNPETANVSLSLQNIISI